MSNKPNRFKNKPILVELEGVGPVKVMPSLLGEFVRAGRWCVTVQDLSKQQSDGEGDPSQTPLPQ